MNFNYSYRAFLISCLLVGGLVLLLVSVRLSGVKQSAEKYAPVEYTEELDDEEPKPDTSKKVKIETNRAYNEAEKFISEIESSRIETPDETAENNEELEDSDDFSFNNDLALNDAKDKLNRVKEKLYVNSRTLNTPSEDPSANKKTTISYSLEGRKALRLRNPVYTCDGSGKIVINIEVNDMGKVVKTTYNKTASTTANGCLIEGALEYASRSKFSTAAAKVKQIGTITYVFPGQY